MQTRRTFLGRAVLGSGVLAGTAGCIGRSGESNAAEGGELEATFTDPRSSVPPRFYAGYDVAVADVFDRPTLSSILPPVAERFLDQVQAGIEGIEIEELDRMTGTKYRKTALSGGQLVIPRPEGQGMHVIGSFDRDPLLAWLDATELERLPSNGEYEQFVRQGNHGSEAFAVTDGRLIYGSRTNVETGPEAVLETERGTIEGQTAPTSEFVPDFFTVFRALDDGAFRAGVAFAHLPLAADTGVEAFDDAIPGLVGAGISADLQDDGSIQRVLRYLEGEAVSPETVQAAFRAGADRDGSFAEPDVSWTLEADSQQLSARSTVDLETIRSDPAFLTSALPSPGYERIYNPVNPSKIGQRGTPQVAISAGIDAGHVTLEFLGGKPEADLRVRYVHKGEQKHETWSTPLEEGDTFRSDRTVDAGSELWVVGRPDTVDASIIIRLQA